MTESDIHSLIAYNTYYISTYLLQKCQDLGFIIHKYTYNGWLPVQTYVQEMHYFRLFLSVEIGSLYNGYSIQQNVTIIIL